MTFLRAVRREGPLGDVRENADFHSLSYTCKNEAERTMAVARALLWALGTATDTDGNCRGSGARGGEATCKCTRADGGEERVTPMKMTERAMVASGGRMGRVFGSRGQGGHPEEVTAKDDDEPGVCGQHGVCWPAESHMTLHGAVGLVWWPAGSPC